MASTPSKQRPKTRELIRWDNDKDIKLLLGIYEICLAKSIRFPWDDLGRLIGPTVTGNAVCQHLVKLKRKLSETNPELVPDVQRPPTSKPSTKTARMKTADQGTPTNAGRTTRAKKKGQKYSSTPDDETADINADPDGDYGVPSTGKLPAKPKRKGIKVEESDESPTKKPKYAGKKVPDYIADKTDSENDDEEQYVAAGSSFIPFKRDNIVVKTHDGPSDDDDGKAAVHAEASDLSEQPSKVVTLHLSSENLASLFVRKRELYGLDDLDFSTIEANAYNDDAMQAPLHLEDGLPSSTIYIDRGMHAPNVNVPPSTPKRRSTTNNYHNGYTASPFDQAQFSNPNRFGQGGMFNGTYSGNRFMNEYSQQQQQSPPNNFGYANQYDMTPTRNSTSARGGDLNVNNGTGMDQLSDRQDFGSNSMGYRNVFQSPSMYGGRNEHFQQGMELVSPAGRNNHGPSVDPHFSQPIVPSNDIQPLDRSSVTADEDHAKTPSVHDEYFEAAFANYDEETDLNPDAAQTQEEFLKLMDPAYGLDLFDN